MLKMSTINFCQKYLQKIVKLMVKNNLKRIYLLKHLINRKQSNPYKKPHKFNPIFGLAAETLLWFKKTPQKHITTNQDNIKIYL